MSRVVGAFIAGLAMACCFSPALAVQEPAAGPIEVAGSYEARLLLPGVKGAEGPAVENTIRCWNVSCSLSQVFNPATGELVQYKRADPVRFRKLIDDHSLRLARALVNGERLDRVLIRMYVSLNDGQRRANETLELQGVLVTQFERAIADVREPTHEEVSLKYDRIIWTRGNQRLGYDVKAGKPLPD